MNERYSIPKPCHRKWTDLRGEGRERFCDECRTPVYAKDAYSDVEWEGIWKKAGGHVCGMLGGGSVSVGRSRRAVLAGALLTAISPLLAQDGRLRVRVTDPADSVVAGAEISVLGTDNRPTRTVRADRVGEAVLAGLPPGECRIAVSSPGFKTKLLTVVAANGQELNVPARLEIGEIAMGVIVEAAVPLTGSVRVRVTDATGSPIMSAQGSALRGDGHSVQTVQANRSGELVFTSLPFGDFRILVVAVGFGSQQLNVRVQGDPEVRIEAQLELDTVGTVIRLPSQPDDPSLEALPVRRHEVFVPGTKE